MAGLIIFAIIAIAFAHVLGNRTPEEKELDQRHAAKRQWCEHKGGPCNKIKDYKRPYRYCMSKCIHYRYIEAGLFSKKFYDDVYKDDF